MCKGLDPDELCAYSTPRFVRIRDRWLGIIHNTLLLLIFGYIVGFNIIANKGYRKMGTVVGTARFQLQHPDIQYRETPAQHKYCGNGTFIAPGSNVVMPQYPCKYVDEYDIVFPPIEAGAIFATSRVKIINQVLNSPDCANLSYPTCNYTNQGPTSYYFVPDLEFFTLYIDHTMSVVEFNLNRTASQMSGTLVDLEGNKLDPCAPYARKGWVCPPQRPNAPGVAVGDVATLDIVPLATILEAAGIMDMDQVAGTTPDLVNQTMRNAGIILVMSLTYDNYHSFHEDDITYKYSVNQIPNAEYKGEQVFPGAGMDEYARTIFDRHGLRIVVRQSGTVGHWDIPTLLVSLVTSLGLLAVAASVVNFLAFGVFPMKYIYNQYRVVTSVDFSDVAHLPKAVLNRFRAEDLINPRPAIFEEIKNAGGVASGALRSPQVAVNPATNKQQGFFSAVGANLETEVPGDASVVVNPLADIEGLEEFGGAGFVDGGVVGGAGGAAAAAGAINGGGDGGASIPPRGSTAVVRTVTASRRDT